MNRSIRIITVLLIGLSSGCGENNASVVLSDVIGYVDIDTSRSFDDRAPAVAFDGTNYLVAYEEVFSNTDHDAFGALVIP